MRWTPVLTVAALVLAGCAAEGNEPMEFATTATPASSSSAGPTDTSATSPVPGNATTAPTGPTASGTMSSTVTATSTSLTMTATSTSAPGGPITLTGEVTVPCTVHCFPEGSAACFSFLSGENGLDCHYWEVGDVDGLPFVAESTNGDIDLDFYDACSAAPVLIDTSQEEGQEAGTIPAGTGCIVGWDFLPGPPATLTVVIG